MGGCVTCVMAAWFGPEMNSSRSASLLVIAYANTSSVSMNVSRAFLRAICRYLTRSSQLPTDKPNTTSTVVCITMAERVGYYDSQPYWEVYRKWLPPIIRYFTGSPKMPRYLRTQPHSCCCITITIFIRIVIVPLILLSDSRM